MTKENIFNYISETPENTNFHILGQMLDELLDSKEENPNYIEVIEGTLENPWGDYTISEISDMVSSDNATCYLYHADVDDIAEFKRIPICVTGSAGNLRAAFADCTVASANGTPADWFSVECEWRKKRGHLMGTYCFRAQVKHCWAPSLAPLLSSITLSPIQPHKKKEAKKWKKMI